MTALPFRRFMSMAASLLCLSMAACKSTKKSGYSDVVDYTTPETNLSQSEYPFDEKGNYLADVVSGKRKGSRNKAIEPPKSYVDTYEKPPEPIVASTRTAAATTGSANYETPPAATSNPYAPVYSSGNAGSGSTAATGPKYTSSGTSSSASASKPRASSSSASKAKPKPKVVAKAKPKPKPKAKPQPTTVSYTVKRGDTLYGLASRYGTSVSAIKKASGLSGDMLRDGRTIRIPRK